MLVKLYDYRFELFFVSVLSILFGSLIFPKPLYANSVLPVLFILNFVIGILFFLKKKNKKWIVTGLFLFVFIVFLYRLIFGIEPASVNKIKFIVYFVFYLLTTIESIRQVWKADVVNKSVIFGLMNGYISLGLLAFFTFFLIELAIPGSFSGLTVISNINNNVDDLLYYSYVTLMTIGYGDIVPVSSYAQKVSILFAMAGQFYMVIITAIVLEKYMRHSRK